MKTFKFMKDVWTKHFTIFKRPYIYILHESFIPTVYGGIWLALSWNFVRFQNYATGPKIAVFWHELFIFLSNHYPVTGDPYANILWKPWFVVKVVVHTIFTAKNKKSVNKRDLSIKTNVWTKMKYKYSEIKLYKWK